jgi:hypothetical protein
MKRFLFVLGLVIFIPISCEKEITYTQEQLNGTWEALELSSLGCVQQLIITQTNLSEVNMCGILRTEVTADAYSFDGRMLKYTLYGIHYEFEVKELTEDKLLLGYHDPIEYRRISD